MSGYRAFNEGATLHSIKLSSVAWFVAFISGATGPLNVNLEQKYDILCSLLEKGLVAKKVVSWY